MARFEEDLRAFTYLVKTQSVTAAQPDSPTAGRLAVRLAVIHSMNRGYDNCGGQTYEEPISIEWVARTIDGRVTFEAVFANSEWDVSINAC